MLSNTHQKGYRNTGRYPFVFLSVAVVLLLFHGPALGQITANYLSSIPVNDAGPIRIAADQEGVLYVAASDSGKIVKYAQDGTVLGSINGFKRPISVAVDTLGKIYVGDFRDGSISVLNPEGSILFRLGKGKGEFAMPSDIVVASSGRVYVTDGPNNAVKVYGPDGTYKFSFGTNVGQLTFPTGIAFDEVNQEIYAVDQTWGRVLVFGTDGIQKRAIGRYGNTPGRLTRPQGIYVSNGKLYVADSYQSSVGVYNTNGTYVYSSFFIGQFGDGPGKFKLPMDVVVVGTTLFVSNTGNRRIEIFDIVNPQGLNVTPSTLSFIADLGSNPAGQTLQISPEVADTQISWTATVSDPFIKISQTSGTTVPAAIATVDIDTTGLSVGTYTGAVTFHANGIDYPVTVSLTIRQQQNKLVISPDSIGLAYVNGTLTSQAISVNAEGGTLSWTASTDAPWLILSAASGTTPGSVTASLDMNEVNKLTDGTYNATITITAPNAQGSPAAVSATLTVVRQRLVVSPSVIDMFHQVDGELASHPLSIGISGGNLNWTALTDAQWLTLSMSSGTTAGVMTVSLNGNANTLAEGTHNGLITVTAPNAINSPVTVPVSVKVVVAGTIIVNTNLDEASFTITGPTVFTGSGKYWRTDEAKPGMYSVQFAYIKGFRRPPTRGFEIKTGRTVTLDVQFEPLPVANVIAGAKGPDPKNEALVRLLDLNGNLISEFKAFETKYGARVAMGDIDGDGTDEMIVAPGPGPQNQAFLKVYRYDGSVFASANPVTGTIYGANVVAGDIDGDGTSEIAMSMVDMNGAQTVVLYGFDGIALVEKTRISLNVAGATYPANVAFGDINGDGWLELITMSLNSLMVYGFDPALSSASVIASASTAMPSGDYKQQLTVSAGDLDGDGIDEIILGITDVQVSSLYALKGDLTSYGLSFKAFEQGKSSPNLSSMDSDGDGIPEILVGQGAHPNNDAVLRIYDAKGNRLKEIKVFDSSKYGVNAAFGVKR